MFTINYKNYWLHGYCDSPQVRVQNPDLIIVGNYKSMWHAKRAVGVMIKAKGEL